MASLELDEALSLELDSTTLLELADSELDDATASLELELSTLSLELDASELMPEPLSHGQPDSVTLSPLHPAQKKAVVVSRRFFQCLRKFILVPLHHILF